MKLVVSSAWWFDHWHDKSFSADPNYLNNNVSYPYILKLNQLLQPRWVETYFERQNSGVSNLIVKADGRIIFVGATQNYAWVCVIAPWGEFICDILDTGSSSRFKYIQSTGEEEVLVVGTKVVYPSPYPGYPCIWVARIEIPRLAVPTVDPLPTSIHVDFPFPNPFNSTLFIPIDITGARETSIKIFDIKGQLVSTLDLPIEKSGKITLVWDSGDLPDGEYLICYYTGNSVQVRKAVKIK